MRHLGGFSLAKAGTCSNITGATGSAATFCFRRTLTPAVMCPPPPPLSGFSVVLAGALGSGLDGWAQATPVAAQNLTAKWSTWLRLAPNDRNFPASALPAMANGTHGMDGTSGLPDSDMEGMLTGIYGSAVGCLVTYVTRLVCR